MGSFAAHPPKKGYEMGRDKGGTRGREVGRVKERRVY